MCYLRRLLTAAFIVLMIWRAFNVPLPRYIEPVDNGLKAETASVIPENSFDQQTHCLGALRGPGPPGLPGDGEQTNNDTKYVVFHPQAGLGNVMIGFVSACMYACLTNRTLRVAPRRRGVAFARPSAKQRLNGFDESLEEMYRPYEMDLPLEKEFLQNIFSRVFQPDAWAPHHCPMHGQDIEKVLCDDDDSTQRFVHFSSYQYYGDVLRHNPHFRHRLVDAPYRNIIRAKLRPSAKVAEKMTTGGPYPVCIHVRWDADRLDMPLTQWLQSLEACVNGLMPTTATSIGSNNTILLFTMHEKMRRAIREHFSNESMPIGQRRTVKFASTTNPEGHHNRTSDDRLVATADVISMGTQCLNILASQPWSTYVRMAMSLMDEPRMYPVKLWNSDVCRRDLPPPIAITEPTDDMWEPHDYCKMKIHLCPADASAALKIANETSRTTYYIAHQEVPGLVREDPAKLGKTDSAWVEENRG